MNFLKKINFFKISIFLSLRPFLSISLPLRTQPIFSLPLFLSVLISISLSLYLSHSPTNSTNNPFPNYPNQTLNFNSRANQIKPIISLSQSHEPSQQPLSLATQPTSFLSIYFSFSTPFLSYPD